MPRKDHQFRLRFGRALRERRLEAGFTQLDLAVAAGLSEAYISQIERGINATSVEATLELAKALGTTVGDLVEDAAE